MQMIKAFSFQTAANSNLWNSYARGNSGWITKYFAVNKNWMTAQLSCYRTVSLSLSESTSLSENSYIIWGQTAPPQKKPWNLLGTFEPKILWSRRHFDALAMWHQCQASESPPPPVKLPPWCCDQSVIDFYGQSAPTNHGGARTQWFCGLQQHEAEPQWRPQNSFLAFIYILKLTHIQTKRKKRFFVSAV